jgi:hypothetical protein
MRNFYTLTESTISEDTGVMTMAAGDSDTVQPLMSMRREGGYVSISVSHGPMEVALRPRFAELTRVLARLRPVNGLQTTRQVGTGQAYLALGLREDGALVVRPTIVADATGLMTFNLLLSPSTREALFEWLPVEHLEDD